MDADNELLYLSLCLFLGLFFGLSGCSKLLGMRSFIQGVRRFQLLPEPLDRLVGILIPPLEIAVATGFLVFSTLIITPLVTLALLAIFSTAIAVNLARGRQIPCHCYGDGSVQVISWGLIIRNALLALTTLLLLVILIHKSETYSTTLYTWVRGNLGNPLYIIIPLLLSLTVLLLIQLAQSTADNLLQQMKGG